MSVGNQAQDRGEIQIAIGQLDDAVSKINGIQQGLTSEISTLMGGWEGDAARAFQQGHQQFDERFNQTKQELSSIHERLSQSLSDYTANEAEQQSAANSIAGMIS